MSIIKYIENFQNIGTDFLVSIKDKVSTLNSTDQKLAMIAVAALFCIGLYCFAKVIQISFSLSRQAPVNGELGNRQAPVINGGLPNVGDEVDLDNFEIYSANLQIQYANVECVATDEENELFDKFQADRIAN
jgi:hypothetical protein